MIEQATITRMAFVFVFLNVVRPKINIARATMDLTLREGTLTDKILFVLNIATLKMDKPVLIINATITGRIVLRNICKPSIFLYLKYT